VSDEIKILPPPDRNERDEAFIDYQRWQKVLVAVMMRPLASTTSNQGFLEILRNTPCRPPHKKIIVYRRDDRG
jgi:hypothetical protein